MATRNPPWAHDELILALELYLREGQLDSNHPLVSELSTVLNALPIHTVRPDAEKFRNPNGVAMKLANYAALDPNYPGAGLGAGGRRDAEVWDRYADKPEELKRVAALIRTGATGDDHAFPASQEEDEDEVLEGRLLFRRHRVRERNATITRRKKTAVRNATGRLACEICNFDFAATYGDLGADFIECHHKTPLSHREETTTTLNDLAVVCSNCHRMLHRRQPWPSIDDLKATITR